MSRPFLSLALAALCLLSLVPDTRAQSSSASTPEFPTLETAALDTDALATLDTGPTSQARLRAQLEVQRKAAEKALERPFFPTEPRRDALIAARDALASTVREIRKHSQAAEVVTERDRWILLLIEAKQAHRQVANAAPAAEATVGWNEELTLIEQEIGEARHLVAAWGRELARLSVEQPQRWVTLSLDEFFVVLLGSLELLLLALGWFYARRWAQPRLMRWFKVMQARRQRLHESGKLTRFDHFGVAVDLRDLAKPSAAVVRTLIDVLVAFASYRWVLAPWPLLHLLALLWLLSSIFRLGMHLARLVVTSADAERPGLILMGRARRLLVERTVRVLLLWGLGTLVVSRLLLSLGLERLHGYWQQVFVAGTLLLLLLFLGAWAPWLRGAVALQLEANPVTRWLIRTDGGPPMRLLRASCAALLLILLALARLVGEIFGNHAWSTWLRTLLARRQLRDTLARRAPLPPKLRQDLLAAETVRLPRLQERQVVEDAYVAWRRSQRSGLAVVLGDTGMGKSTFLDQAEVHLLRLLRSEGAAAPKLQRLRLEHHLHSPLEALRWLSTTLTDVPATTPHETPHETTRETTHAQSCVTLANGNHHDADDAKVQHLQQELREKLEAMPTHVFLVDDLHKLLLRSVGGFDALRRVLEVLQVTAEEHFWLTTFHLPTWSYLEGVPELVNLGVFSHVLPLQEFRAEQLRDWLEGRCRVAGCRLRFEPLVAPALIGADSERALHRTTDAFWRLLADASMGNPHVALHYWLDGLHDGHALPAPRQTLADSEEARAEDSSTETPVDESAQEPIRDAAVGLFEAPTREDTENLRADELFVLSALVVHDGLGAEQLSQVLNMPPARLRSVCRHLEGRGLLDGDDAGVHYSIDLAWRPAILRLLHSKHFLELRLPGTVG